MAKIKATRCHYLKKKYFYFLAIDIVIPTGDSNLGPKAFSLLEIEIVP